MAATFRRRRRVAFFRFATFRLTLRAAFFRVAFFRFPTFRLILRAAFFLVAFLRAAILGHPPVACLDRGLALRRLISFGTARASSERRSLWSHLRFTQLPPFCSCPLSDPGTCDLTGPRPFQSQTYGSRATLAAHANTRISSSSSNKRKKNNAMAVKAAGRGMTSVRFTCQRRTRRGTTRAFPHAHACVPARSERVRARAASDAARAP